MPDVLRLEDSSSILDPGRSFFGERKIYQRRNINPRRDYSELCHDVDVVLEPLDIDQGIGLVVVVLGRIYPIRVLLNRDLSDVGHLLDRVGVSASQSSAPWTLCITPLNHAPHDGANT